MKQNLLTILRNESTSNAQYRLAANKLGDILAAECSQYFDHHTVDVKTPLASTEGTELTNGVILVPVLRAGLSLLHPFMRFYPDARVGFIGLRRDEETARPSMYYLNMPPILPDDKVIVLEPMIATGGSVSRAIQAVLDQGANPNQIIVASVIASMEGLGVVRNLVPEANLHVVQIDQGLNDQKFIVPGLGDFGDRYFGTEESEVQLKEIH